MKKLQTILLLSIVVIAIAFSMVWATGYTTANYSARGGDAWVVGGGGRTGTLTIDPDGSLIYEGATANDYETTIAVVDPTADRIATIPDATGYVSLANVTALTATTNLNANQCYGTIFTNTNIADSTVNLPVAVVGMAVTFVNTDVNDITINPQDGTSIICNGLTPAAGDAISSDKALGSSVTLAATTTTEWAVISKIGTWADVN